jgi:thioredoxin:protein disulfide reductase
MRRLKILILILIVPFNVFGAAKINPNPLKIVQTHLQNEQVQPGKSSTLVINWLLDPAYHAYADQFKLEALTYDNAHISIQEISPIVEFEDKFSKKRRKGATGQGRMTAVIDWPSPLPMGKFQMDLQLTYQACTEDHCLLPKHIPLQITAINQTPMGMPSLAGFSEKGWKIWLIVFLAGVLTSLTPCIFPLIPITIAVLSARGVHSRRMGFLLSLSYVLGIAATYAVLGVVAASTGALFGAFLGHPYVISALAVLFVVLGLSMLGWFSIETPRYLTQRLITHKTQGGFVGAFLAGTIAGVVASPCVGPVLAGVLTYVAQSRDVVMGFALLFVFALGLGQLFLLLGTFSNIRQKLPKSGPWMNAIKFLFALTFFGLALFYLRPLISEDFAWRLIGVFLLLGVLHPEDWRQTKIISLTRVKAAVVFIVIAVAGALIFTGSPATWFAKAPTEITQTKVLPFVPYSEKVLAQAQVEGMPVMIDFYADWCVACKELEQFTFSAPEVQALATEFVFVKFDATQSTPLFEELQSRYGIVGLPFIVFIDGKGHWRQDLTLTGFEDAPEFVKRLQELIKK